MKESKVKVNGYSSGTLWAKRKRRQVEAQDRQVVYDGLTLEEKITQCLRRNRRGKTKGQGKRELDRLYALKWAEDAAKKGTNT